MQRWDDGSGRITVIRSKTDVEAGCRRRGGHHPRRHAVPWTPSGRRVKVIAKIAGLADWEFFSGHSGRVGMAQNGAPTHEIERQGRWKQGGGMVGRYTRGETAGSALRYL